MVMHRSEDRDLESCIECGAETSVDEARGFRVDPERVLCHDCAIKRGGAYDEGHDHWDPTPQLEKLPVAAGGHP